MAVNIVMTGTTGLSVTAAPSRTPRPLSDPLHPLLFVILGGAVVVMFGNRSATTAAPSTVSSQR